MEAKLRIADRYKQMSGFERVIFSCSIILSMIVLASSFAGLTGIVESRVSNLISQPVMGIVLLLNGLIMYKKDKNYGCDNVLYCVFRAHFICYCICL